MAGFSNIGEPGYQISPPNLSQAYGSPGFVNTSIPHPIRNYAGYFQPSQYGMQNQADESEQHRMNIYLAQNGLSETGQQKLPGYSEYGFSPDDWKHITNFLSNPLSNQNLQNYQGITNRLNDQANINPQFSTWTPEQRRQWSTDMPIRMASGFGAVPAPILQYWGLPYPAGGTNNLRF